MSAPPAAGRDPKGRTEQPLRIVLELTGDLRGEAALDGRSVLLRDRTGRQVSTYDHLKAWDATGRELPSRMRVRGREVALEVDDAAARYPVTIDPTLWQQQARLTADSGAAHDQFGWAVAISGNRAIVGAREDNAQVGGAHLGSAYIFVRSGSTWTEERKLIPSDGVALSIFGFSVAISGNTAIVGAPFGGDGRGKAYVYFRDENGDWVEQAKLAAVAPTAGDRFGYSVGISGDTAIVGSFPIGAGRTQGAAYVFSRAGDVWELPYPLIPSDPAPGDTFGFAVAISGDTAVVGAPIKTIDGKLVQGAAYLFARSDSGWLQKGPRLTGSGGVERDFFGGSVAISGETAVVQFQNQLNAGARGAHFFTRTGGAWTEQQKISAPNASSRLGRVGISGETAIVGTSMYARTGGVWSEQAQFTVSDGDASSSLGVAGVGISGETAIVGAYTADVGSNVNQGSAFVFLRSPDSDGDGLPDDWETSGVTIDGVHIDLPAKGADPRHKDVFVHVEWLQPDPARSGALFKPRPRALKIVSDAFLRAPVVNPDGKPGIRLHVDAGPDSVMNPLTGQKWGSQSRTGNDDLPYQALTGRLDANGEYDWSDIETIKRMHFLPAKRAAVFHYAVFLNTRPGGVGDTSGTSRGIVGGDFLVSLGHPSWSGPAAASIGTDQEQAGTFMHELGHNLGLRHGGFEGNPNGKPNYLSVMNYPFQTGGLLRANGTQREFDYSRTTLPPLDETALDENFGIADPAMHMTLWRCGPPAPPALYFRRFLPSRALDWNVDGVRGSAVAADINCDGTRGTLTGFADWPELVFDGGGRIGNASGVGASDPLTTPSDEPSREELLAGVPQELLDEEAVAPLDETTVLPRTGGAPLTVAFDGSASTAVGGTIVDWAWDFGDGTSGSGATVNHTYATPGEYYASLTVTDSAGRVNLVPLLTLVTVDDSPPATPTPTATARPTPTPVATPTPTPAPTLAPGQTATPAPTLAPGQTATPVVTPTAIPTPSPEPMAGDVDPTFEATVTSRDGEVINVVVTQPDGKVIVAGDFESFGRCARWNIARVNPDGSCDATFDPGLALTDVFEPNHLPPGVQTRRSLAVYALALQPDGKVLVGVQAIRGPRNGVSAVSSVILRLEADGTRDWSFDDAGFDVAATEPRVTAIAIQPDGKILAAGNIRYGTNGRRIGVARLNLDGSIDPSFTLPSGFFWDGPTLGLSSGSAVSAVALQNDGKIVIAGGFSEIGSTAVSTITRLAADGSVDTAFNVIQAGLPVSRFGFGTAINEIAIQSDGKLVIAGAIYNLADSALIAFARLNADGSRDSSFSTAFGANSFGSNTGAFGLALQADGKLVVAGRFQNTAPIRHSIARLNSDGTLDASFDTGSGMAGPRRHNEVNAVALRAGGKVVVAGNFDTFNGAAAEGILQLDQNGNRDPTFASPFSSEAAVDSFLLQPDGKILMNGSFRLIGATAQIYSPRLNADGTVDGTFNVLGRTLAVRADGKIFASMGIPFSRATELVLLNPDGSRDATFTPHFFPNGGAGTLALQPDGRMVISGVFSLADGRDARVARLNADGSFDTTFDPGSGPNDIVRALVVQSDGRTIIAGKFSGYDGSVQASRISRLNTDGSLDTSFDPFNPKGRNVGALALQPDGKLFVGIQDDANDSASTLSPVRVYRLDTNGGLDPSFPIANTGIEPINGAVNAIVLEPGGDVVVGGSFEVVNGTARLGLARLLGTTPSSATATPAPAATPTAVPTSTATPTATETPAATATATPAPSVPGPTPSPETSPTVTSTPALTPSPEPTASPSPGLTPASTPTASPALQPHAVECYRARSESGTPRFVPIEGVRLDDGFESILTRIVRETSLCNDVSIDRAAAPGDRVGVLACYHLESVAGEQWARPGGVTIANRFGEQQVEFVSGSSERTLCVPAGAALASRADDAVDPLDRLRCRRVRSKRLAPAPEFVLGDAFETKRMRVRSIRSLCTPVALGGDEAPASDDLLACYNVAQVPGQRGFRPPGVIEVESELASQTLTLRNAQRTLCVPTERR